MRMQTQLTILDFLRKKGSCKIIKKECETAMMVCIDSVVIFQLFFW